MWLKVMSVIVLSIGVFSLVSAIMAYIEDKSDKTKKLLLLFFITIPILTVLMEIDCERVDVYTYRTNMGQIEVMEQRKEDIEGELEVLINSLPEDTLELYKEIGTKEDSINLYPNIEFIKLIEEQMKTQKELQKELTKLYREQSSVVERMKNRRLYYPAKLIYRDNVNDKLEKLN